MGPEGPQGSKGPQAQGQKDPRGPKHPRAKRTPGPVTPLPCMEEISSTVILVDRDPFPFHKDLHLLDLDLQRHQAPDFLAPEKCWNLEAVF